MCLGLRVQLVREADNLNAIYKLIIYTIWDPQLTTLDASMACYGDNFTFSFYFTI
jgi:hypothetical protein